MPESLSELGSGRESGLLGVQDQKSIASTARAGSTNFLIISNMDRSSRDGQVPAAKKISRRRLLRLWNL